MREVHVLELNGHAGDVLISLPVLRAFRRAHPDWRVYFECDPVYHPLLAGNPDVDFAGPLGRWKGPRRRTKMADFSGKPWASSWTHIMDAMAQACGVGIADRSYGLRIPADADRRGREEAEASGSFAAVHVRSSCPSKDWALANWASLAGRIRSDLGLEPVQIGGNNDPSVPGARDLRGRLSFMESAAFLSRAEVFFGVDSLPMHLSRAVREVPAVVFWGSSSPVTSGLFGTKVVNLEPTRACGHAGRPCWARCDWHSQCVDRASVEEAVAAAKRLIGPRTGPRITVVLVNWNSWSRWTHPMLNRLEASCSGSDWDVVLVDNGSPGDGPHLVRWASPRVSRKVLWPENRGLPAAWNEALRHARGEIVAFMNTDVEVLRDGWDTAALKVFDSDPAISALGISANEPPRFFGEERERTAAEITEGALVRCHHVNGAALFVRRAALDRVGGFDEMYTPGYCEETDWCMRASLMGEQVWHLGGVFNHLGRRITKGVNKMDIAPLVAKNNAYFAGKWAGARVQPLLDAAAPAPTTGIPA